MSVEGVSECFDRCACAKGRRAEAGSIKGVSRILLELLDDGRLTGASVLEVGCGLGGLTLSMAKRDTARSTGVDLSPESIRAASRLAAESGLADRTAFLVGDGAEIALPASDVVVLDKVICCYPAVDALLQNSLLAATRSYAFAAPMSSGLRGMVARAVLGFENTLRRIRRDPFRAFVHDLRRVEERIAEAGFERTAGSRRFIWSVAVFERPALSPTARASGRPRP